jgi:hypothetical protein
MNKKEKLIHELKAFTWSFLYFLLWFAGLVLIKALLLHEYEIHFFSLSTAFIGALVVAKVVLILDNLPLSRRTIKYPAYVHIIFRTVFFSFGVFLMMIIETAFEGRHKYSGFIDSLLNVFSHVNIYQVYVNSICVAGALLVFNFLSLLNRYLGEGGIGKILIKPFPEPHKETREI